MTTSSLFHLEHRDLEFYDAPNYVVLSCLQWRSPSLDTLLVAGKQTFAVMYGTELQQDLIDLLEHAHLQGALPAVQLIAADDFDLHIFLHSKVSSLSVPIIESLWKQAMKSYSARPWSVAFSSVDDVLQGRTGYVFQSNAKRVLESHTLGISGLNDFRRQMLIDYDLPRLLPSLQPRQAYLCERTLEIVKRRIEGCGKRVIRDQCIVALFDAGVRLHELHNMRAGASMSSEAGLEVKATSARLTRTIYLPDKSKELLSSYIKASGLTGSDYLFSSSTHPQSPMHVVELQRIHKAWKFKSHGTAGSACL